MCDDLKFAFRPPADFRGAFAAVRAPADGQRTACAPPLRRGEKIVSWLVLGPIAPVSLGLAAWWSTVLLGWSEPHIALATVAACAVGVAGTMTLGRRRAAALWQLGEPARRGVAVFYSVMIYGCFMGMPVGNVLVGVGGGLILGWRVGAGAALGAVCDVVAVSVLPRLGGARVARGGHRRGAAAPAAAALHRHAPHGGGADRGRRPEPAGRALPHGPGRRSARGTTAPPRGRHRPAGRAMRKLLP
jgi:hypothetical protein